jgi:sterol desaturase/sphingolipid hydroxylase (fatty acid hydroxylase superfamily)
MKTDLHSQAKDFIRRQHVEFLSPEEQRWLNAHLAECESCAQENFRLDGALCLLRGMHLDLPRNLASRTQFRVRMRSEELREKEPAKKFVWLIAAVSWALGVATAPWVWHGVEWLGQETGAPRLLLQAGFLLWWSVPPLIAAWAALSEKRVTPAEQSQ